MNRRPTDYETPWDAQILDNRRMGAPFTTPPDSITAVVEQVSEQVALRKQWSQRAASDNRCSQIRFPRSPQPPFSRRLSEPGQLSFQLVRGRLQKTGSMLETIAADLPVSRWRLRQTGTNELVGRRRATAQPGLACSSSRSDKPPITFESETEVLDSCGTQQADPEMVERPQAIDSMGWK